MYAYIMNNRTIRRRRRINICPLTVIALFFLLACSEKEDIPYTEKAGLTETVRYTKNIDGVTYFSGLEELASVEKGLDQVHGKPLLQEDFSSLDEWKNLSEDDTRDESFVLTNLPGGGRAFKIKAGDHYKGRLLWLPSKKLLTAYVRVKLQEGIELNDLSGFLSLCEISARTVRGLATMSLHQVVANHAGWIKYSAKDGWADYYQIFIPSSTTKIIVPCFNTKCSELADVEGVLVSKLVIRDSTLTESASYYKSKAQSGGDGKQLPILRHDAGGELRDSFIFATPARIKFPLTPGEERRLTFGLSFPAAFAKDHAKKLKLTISILESSKFLHQEEILLENVDESISQWFEKIVTIPPVAALSHIRIDCESSKGGEAVVIIGAPILTHPVKKATPPNVILVSIDTLRADKLGAYGWRHPEGVSPFIDSIANESYLFENATAQAPYTLPSHVSMLSGQYPTVHMVEHVGDRIDHKRTKSIASILAEAGYVTGAYTGGGLVHHTFGFDKGFDTYFEMDPVKKQNLNRTIAWLDAHQSEPFFLFFHTYSAHGYGLRNLEYIDRFDRNCQSTLHNMSKAPEYFAWLKDKKKHLERDRSCIENRYAAGIRMADDALKKVIERLEEQGVMDRTLLVITSDHGEELLDRGNIQHGKTLYEELVHVPLIIRPPGGVEPIRIPDLVEVIDAAPTILDFLGLSSPIDVQGQSLLPLVYPEMRGEVPGFVFSEVNSQVHKYSFRTKRYKLIFNIASEDDAIENGFEFFDIRLDPGEEKALPMKTSEFQKHKTCLQQLRKDLRKTATSLKSGDKKGGAISTELMNELRSMGYVK